MAYYLVRGRFDPERLSELHDKLASGAFEHLRPFGKVLSTSLDKARFDPQTGEAVWEEEDYCSPPLAMEREAVLDHYFTGLVVQRVNEGEGWAHIAHLPPLWKTGDKKPSASRLVQIEQSGPACDWQTGQCE